MSDPIEQPGPAHCGVYVKVKFESITVFGNCGMDSYFKLNVRAQDYEMTRSFYGGFGPWTGGSTVRLHCGPNSFAEIADKADKSVVDSPGGGSPPWSEFTLPLPGESKDYATAPFSVWVRANFAEFEAWSSDDVIAKYSLRYDFENLPAATAFLSCGKTLQEDGKGDEGRTILAYTMTIYPNECGDVPYAEKYCKGTHEHSRM